MRQKKITFKPRFLLVVLVLCATGIALAGNISQLVCDKCRFESNDLFEGSGLEGLVRSIVFCPACKNFFTVVTGTAFAEKDSRVQEPLGTREFLFKERKTYACPQCKSAAVVYDGPVCPLCLKGTLFKSNTGNWD